MLPVSNDTLLRAVRSAAARTSRPDSHRDRRLGVARNHRYGTIICDLERRKTIALLPDREPATAQAWLSGQPQIAVVARDRGGGYALAAQKALPHAIQVADRWHLMENASHAFLDAVRKSMRQIRARSARLPSIPTCSPPPRRSNTRATCAAKRPTLPSSLWPKKARRSRRSCAAPATAAASCARSFAVSVRRLPCPREFARSLPALARRAVGDRAAQRCRAMAPAEAAGLSRLPSGGRGMGGAAATGGEGRHWRDQPRSFGTNHRPSDDDRAAMRSPNPRPSPWPRSRAASPSLVEARKSSPLSRR